MDNEKLNNEEIVEEEVTETTEAVVEEAATETVKEAAETIEETVAETDEVIEEIVEATEESVIEIADEVEAVPVVEDAKKGLSLGGIIAIVAGGAVILAAVVAYMLLYFGVINPWEKDYVDTTGVTLEELADQSGYSLREYKKKNGLPFLMPKSTFENAVNNSIKLKVIIAQSDKTLEDWKEHYGWDDSVTEETTVGEAIGKAKLSVIVGSEEYVEIIKQIYELPDTVTGDTLYGEVRNQIDRKTVEMKKEQEEQAAKESENAEEEAPEEAKTEEEASATESAE